MANPRLSARDGLASLAGGADYVEQDDINQIVKARLALAALVASVTGGPGIYSGGAADETELGSGGTTYPAVVAFVPDRDGVLWPIVTTTWKAITFSTPTGSINLYAVPNTQSGITPPAAIGGAADVLILALDASDPAPADGWLLGSGTASSGALTAYTEDANARVSGGLWASALHAARHATGQPDALAPADIGAVPTSRQVAAGTGLTGGGDLSGDRTLSIAAGGVGTSQLAAGAATYAKIQNVSAADRLLGRVTAGAGSIEEITCTAAGRAILDDADAAAQRVTLGLYAVGSSAPGSPSDGDLWWDTTNRILWVYSSAATRWLSSSVSHDTCPINVLPPYSVARGNVAIGRFPTNHDVYLEAVEITAYGQGGTWDASNRWDLKVYTVSTLLGTLAKTTDGITHHTLSVGSAIDTSGGTTYLRVDVQPTGGTEGILNDYLPVCMRYRLARR